MKVAISSETQSIEGVVSARFGRCVGFIIADVENGNIVSSKFVPNPGAQAFRGAGIAAAQAILNENVQAVITSNIGPNAFSLLSQAGIEIYNGAGLSIKEAIVKLSQGTLPRINAPVPGGFGGGFGRGFAGGRGFGRGSRW